MKDLNALFSGAGALANTSDTVKTAMDNGLATISSVTAHTSKKGNECALIKFSGNASSDEDYGHNEYVSMSEGARFARVFGKIVYIVKHSTNEQAKALFAQLPNPVEFIVGADGQPIVFTTNDELAEIREANGEDVTFVWNDGDDSSRVAIRFTNPKEYIAQLITALQGFVGEVYYLELKMDKERGYQRLVSINQPKL
jgi:hypothetical protein